LNPVPSGGESIANLILGAHRIDWPPMVLPDAGMAALFAPAASPVYGITNHGWSNSSSICATAGDSIHQVAQTELEPRISVHAQDYDFAVEVATLEQLRKP
jgi:hypothetical protein